MASSEPAKRYVIVAPWGKVEAQRSSPKFRHAIQLGRIINTIRFAHEMALASLRGSDAVAMRGKISSFLYLVGVLSEALKYSKRIRGEYSGSPAFKNGLGALLDDQALARLEEFSVRLRDQAIYHHDDAVIENGLRDLDSDPIIFLRLDGLSRKGAHYALADEVVLNFAFPGATTSETFAGSLREHMRMVISVAMRFDEAASDLIFEYLDANGWSTRAVAEDPA